MPKITTTTQLASQIALFLSWVRDNQAKILADPNLGQQVEQTLTLLESDYAIEMAEAQASPKQLKFQKEFFARTFRTYAALGGNRSGKSIVGGRMCFAKWLRDRARPDENYWCVAPTFEKSVGQQELLWKSLPRWMFGEKSWDPKNGFDGQRPIIQIQLPRSRIGREASCVVSFKTSNQDMATFEQSSISGAWCDEHLPMAVFHRLIPRTIDKAGWIMITDIPEQDWYWFDLLHAKPAAKVLAVQMSMYDNQHNLPEGEIDLAKARLTQEEADMRIGGEFRRLTGVVYREFDRNLHVCQPFRIPSEGEYGSVTHWPRWRCLDYGGSSPTACIWFAISPDETIYVYREHYVPGPSVFVHAKAVKAESLDGWGKPEQYVDNLIDPAAYNTSPGNEVNIAQQYAEEGIPFNPWPNVAIMGEHAMVQRVKRRLENMQIKVFSSCEHTLREFAAWKYKCNTDGIPLAADAYENGNNHALDCIKGFVGTNPTFTIPKIIVGQ